MEPSTSTQPPQQPIQQPSIPPTGYRSDMPPQSMPQNNQVNITPKKYKYLKGLLVVLLCEVLIGAGLAAYFWRDSQAMQKEAELESQIQELQVQIKELEAIDNTTDETLDFSTETLEAE